MSCLILSARDKKILSNYISYPHPRCLKLVQGILPLLSALILMSNVTTFAWLRASVWWRSELGTQDHRIMRQFRLEESSTVSSSTPAYTRLSCEITQSCSGLCSDWPLLSAQPPWVTCSTACLLSMWKRFSSYPAWIHYFNFFLLSILLPLYYALH